jgi:hypothetical protein
VLDAVDELLRIEFAISGRNVEQRSRLWALVDVRHLHGLAADVLGAGDENSNWRRPTGG